MEQQELEYAGSAGFRIPVTVPTGMALFPNEISKPPLWFVTSKFTDIISYNRLAKGGHFAAMEVPGALSEDLFGFVTKVEERRKRTKGTSSKFEL